MKTDKIMPKVGQVAEYIKENSPENSKCIDVDLLPMQGFCLIAWVIEKALSKDQGYQQACVVSYQNGKFGEIKDSIPCRYYEEEGRKKITSCAFGSFSDEKAPGLLEKRTDEEAYVTLVCSGKPISQMLIQGKNAQKNR